MLIQTRGLQICCGGPHPGRADPSDATAAYLAELMELRSMIYERVGVDFTADE